MNGKARPLTGQFGDKMWSQLRLGIETDQIKMKNFRSIFKIITDTRAVRHRNIHVFIENWISLENCLKTESPKLHYETS